MEKLKQYIENIVSLSDTEWNEASSLFTKEEVRKGDFFVEQGRTCNKIAFVEKGLLRLYYLLNGEEKTTLFFPEHQFATDYFSFLTQTPSKRPIDAIEDTVVFSISSDKLHKLFRFKNWERIGRIMAENAYKLSVIEANRLLHDDFETRYVTFLKENSKLVQRVPQYMIASYLKMTPETLSRVKRRINQDEKYNSIHESTGLM